MRMATIGGAASNNDIDNMPLAPPPAPLHTRVSWRVFDAKGCWDWRKIHKVNFGCKLGWEIDFRGLWVNQMKIEQDICSFIFMGIIFFLFCFQLIDAMCIFKKKLGTLWTNYHVIFPYIDAFNTYIVTCASAGQWILVRFQCCLCLLHSPHV